MLLGAVIGAHSPPAELLVTGTLGGAALSLHFVGERTTDVVARHPLLQVLEPLTLQASTADAVLVSLRPWPMA